MRSLITLSVSVSSLAFLAAGALAQAADDPFDLGTLVLQGELQDRTLQDSPTSASVETGEEIEDRGETSVEEVLDRTIGASTSPGFGGFVIRGIDQRGVGAGDGLVISTQVDGVALPSNQAFFGGPFSAWDIDQVEVLRGPQSTQQGRNALAGAVIVRSNDPIFSPEYRLRADVGNEDRRRLALMANTPLGEDFALRFTAEGIEDDNFIENTTLDEPATPEEGRTYRAKLLWAPSDNFEMIFSHTDSDFTRGEFIVNNRVDSADELPPGFYPDEEVTNDFPRVEGNDLSITSLRLAYDISDTLRLETETSYYDSDYVRDEDGDDTPQPLVTFERDISDRVFEQDVQLKFDNDFATGVVGLFYTEIDNEWRSVTSGDVGAAVPDIGTPIGVPGAQITSRDDSESNFAIFGEADIPLDVVSPNLTLTVGGRYDRESSDSSSETVFDVPACDQPVLPPPLDQICPLLQDESSSNDTEFDAFLPKLGITYDLTAAQSVSFTVQRGYRSGGSGTAIDGTTFDFDPEFTTNYEVAYRGTFRDETLIVGGNVYFTNYEDQQVNVRTGRTFFGQPVTETRNAGESELYGFELSVEARPTDQLSVFGGLGFNRSEFVDFESNGVSFDGNSFGEPETTAKLGGEYRWDNGVSFGMDINYTDEGFLDPENNANEKSDERTITNARLNYDAGNGLRVGVYANNLFDEKYVTSRRFVAADNDDPDGAGTYAFSLGDRRQIGVFAEYTF
ncbi:TonB-dependent receptor [Cognatiyoonia sp. IB215182]|uniref:TonB-dependent receptor n=1 Tax=Cognatiyoonia sp. IB215182 TaxID=3097353 RepID=UPI002A11D701|nr:TonB-dependent receptor [Cognatiyoonia sp. IB215182]MDX8354816.1 TonB-dependent receptor [Cognatiyoonia sp. IB215182]